MILDISREELERELQRADYEKIFNFYRLLFLSDECLIIPCINRVSLKKKLRNLYIEKSKSSFEDFRIANKRKFLKEKLGDNFYIEGVIDALRLKTKDEIQNAVYYLLVEKLRELNLVFSWKGNLSTCIVLDRCDKNTPKPYFVSEICLEGTKAFEDFYKLVEKEFLFLISMFPYELDSDEVDWAEKEAVKLAKERNRELFKKLVDFTKELVKRELEVFKEPPQPKYHITKDEGFPAIAGTFLGIVIFLIFLLLNKLSHC